MLVGLGFISDMGALLSTEEFPTAEQLVEKGAEVIRSYSRIYRSHLHEGRGSHFSTTVLMPLLTNLAPNTHLQPFIGPLLLFPDDW